MQSSIFSKLGFSTFLSSEENKKTAEGVIQTSKQVASSNASTSSQSQSQVKEIKDSSGNVVGYEDSKLQMSYFRGREPTSVTQEQTIQETKTVTGKVSDGKIYVTESGLHGKTVTVTYQVQKPSEEELREQAYKYYQEQINELQQQGYRVVQATQGVEFMRVSQPTAVVPFFEDYFNQIKQQNAMQESFTKTYEIVYSKELPKHGEDITFDVTFEKTITQKHFRNPFDIKVVGETGMQSIEAKGFNAMLVNVKRETGSVDLSSVKQIDLQPKTQYEYQPALNPLITDIPENFKELTNHQIKQVESWFSKSYEERGELIAKHLEKKGFVENVAVRLASGFSWENPLGLKYAIASISDMFTKKNEAEKVYYRSLADLHSKDIKDISTYFNPVTTAVITVTTAPALSKLPKTVQIAVGGFAITSTSKNVIENIKSKDYISAATTVAYATVVGFAAAKYSTSLSQAKLNNVNKVYSKDLVISKTENDLLVGQKAISKSVYDTPAGIAKVKTQYMTISAKDSLRIGEVDKAIAKVPALHLNEGQSATVFKSTITLNKHQQTIWGITKAMQTNENEAIYATLAKTAKTKNYYVAVGQAKSTQLTPELVDIKSHGLKIATHTAPRTLITQVETVFSKNTKTSNLVTNIVYDMTTKASNNKNLIASGSKSSSSVQQIVTIPESAIKSVISQLQKTQVKTNVVAPVVLAKTAQETKQEQTLKTSTVTVTKQLTSKEYVQDLKTTVNTKVLDKTIEKTTQQHDKLNYSFLEKAEGIPKPDVNKVYSRTTMHEIKTQHQNVNVNVNVKNINMPVMKNMQQQTIPKINFNANFSVGHMFNTIQAKILQNKQNYAVSQAYHYHKISGKMPEFKQNKIGFLADLLSVSYSQLKFGKATHTMSEKAYNIAKSTHFIRVPTRELLLRW